MTRAHDFVPNKATYSYMFAPEDEAKGLGFDSFNLHLDLIHRLLAGK